MSSFHEISHPPYNDIVDLPPRGDTIPLILPSDELIGHELAFWNYQQHFLDETKNSFAKTLSHDIAGQLRFVLGMSMDLQEALIEQPLPHRLGRVALEQYIEIAAEIAYACFYREVFMSIRERGLVPGPEETEFISDVDPSNPRRGGIFVRGQLMSTLGIKPPEVDTSQWYEGKRIYLRAERPIQPTSFVHDEFMSWYGVPLPEASFTALAPYPKLSYWISRVARES